MYKFYIIFKDGTCIEGEVSCLREIFIERFINPHLNDIDTYQIWEARDENREFTELDRLKMRLLELQKDLASMNNLKPVLDIYDVEDVTDNYQARLEWQWEMDGIEGEIEYVKKEIARIEEGDYTEDDMADLDEGGYLDDVYDPNGE